MSFAWEPSKVGAAVGDQAGEVAATVGKRTLVQRLEQAMAQPAGREPAAPVAEVAQQGFAGPAQRLPHLERIQALFGRHEVSGVQAHVGGPAAEAASGMGAQAYAMGSSVAFARAPDLHTAAHEAAHVVQQRAGVHLAGGVGEAGDPYERHADAVADLVVQGQSAEALLGRHAGGGGPAVQHRTVNPAVYSSFDQGAARQPTQDMIAAGHREEEIAALFSDATALSKQLQELCIDPLIQAEALPHQVAIAGHLATTESGNTLMKLFVDEIEKKYAAVLTPEQLATCKQKGSDIGKRLAATVAARKKIDDLLAAAIAPYVAQTVKIGVNSTTAVAAMRTIVAPLQDKADKLHAGKRAHESNVVVRDTSVRDNVAGRAAAVGVAVPDTGPAFATSQDHADRGEWVEAGQHSSSARSRLDAMRSNVVQAENDKRVYRDALVDMAALRKLSDRFTDLQIEATELDAAIADADAARVAYSEQRWSAAAAGARKATAPLATLQQLVTDFQAYRTNDKLLIGTISEVHRQLRPGADRNRRALDSLKATYEAQCEVTRESWLLHLEIAGVNTVGPNSCHYTKFNDAIPAIVSLSVETDTVATLCTNLFAAVGSFGQLHATRVVGTERYHRYWDGTYSDNVATDDLEHTNAAAYGELNAEHTAMTHWMTAKVTDAKARHGRVAHNDRGQHNAILVV